MCFFLCVYVSTYQDYSDIFFSTNGIRIKHLLCNTQVMHNTTHKYCESDIANWLHSYWKFLLFFFTSFYLLSSVHLSRPSFSLFFHIRKFVLISSPLFSVSLILVLSIVPSLIFMWARVKFWLLYRYISFCGFSFISPSLSLAHVGFYQGLSNLSPVVNISVLRSQVPPSNINKPYPYNKNQQDALLTFNLFQ